MAQLWWTRRSMMVTYYGRCESKQVWAHLGAGCWGFTSIADTVTTFGFQGRGRNSPRRGGSWA